MFINIKFNMTKIIKNTVIFWLVIFAILLQNCGNDETIEKEVSCNNLACNEQLMDSLKFEAFEAIILIGLNGEHLIRNHRGLEFQRWWRLYSTKCKGIIQLKSKNP